MTRKAFRTNALLVAAIIGASIISAVEPAWATLGLAAIGLIAVSSAVPGTELPRATAIVAVLTALLWPATSFVILVLLVLLWPVFFLLTWEREPLPVVEVEVDSVRSQVARSSLSAIIVAVAAAALVYRGLFTKGLEQSSALFVGIPTILAVAVVFLMSPKSATGVACKAVTVGLLVSLGFLGEGMVCVLMSTPLFYAIAVMAGSAIDRARHAEGEDRLFCCVLVLALVPMTLEGVTESTSFNRSESVSVTRVVAAPAAEVKRALLSPPRFERALPRFLRLGFPRPIGVRIDQGPNALWTVRFRGGEMRLDGWEPRAGDLQLELVRHEPGLIEWRAQSDSSHMTHFLDWRGASVAWQAAGPQGTQVTWTLHYRRSLDPAWYFGPWERLATRLAASYLIDSVATP